jgi:integrase
LPDDLKDPLWLTRWRAGSPKRAPDLCQSHRYSTRDRNVTRRGWEAVRDGAGLPKSLSFHDLSHAAASRLIAAGLTPVQVASILGHKDPSRCGSTPT